MNDDDVDDAELETATEWDIQAVFALAALAKASASVPAGSSLMFSLENAARAMSSAIVNYHTPQLGPAH